jgi:hypothetical protein
MRLADFLHSVSLVANRLRPGWFAASLMLVGCGSSPATTAKSAEAPEESAGEKAAAPDESEAGGSAEAKASKAAEIPTECAKKGDVCQPETAFVKKLCAGAYPSVALVMFGKSTPWTRAYLTRKTEGWNASGGASESSWLEFDEEVLVLVQRKAGAGGIQVGSGVGYDVLRWNGSCVSLEGEELTMKRPPTPKASKVEFRQLDEKHKEALREDANVNEAFLSRRKECQAATMGTVSLKCVKADTRLSEVIVDYVRGGGSVPQPDKLPE